MASITVNNRIFNFNSKSESSTIDELIQCLADDEEYKEKIITNISIDGRDLSTQEEENSLPEKILSFKNIDITLQSSIDLAFDALDSCSNYIDVVNAKVKELISFYQENKIESAHALFAEVIDILDLFVQLISKIHKTLKRHLNDRYHKDNTVQNLEIHLLSVLKGLLPAKEKNDIIMLSDLLEYELVDNLTQWKIKAIPQMKDYRKMAIT